MSTYPLRGLRVVELATVLAGPEVGRFLGELGAEVYKYESPAGDVTRGWRLANEDRTSSISAYFAAINAHKTYGKIDLKSSEGRNNLMELLRDADVLITNFKSEDYAKYGLDLEEMKSRFPKLVWGRISGFKSEPERPAFDVVLQAETGWMSMTGEAQRPPVKLPVALIDITAAHQLKEAILIGLIEREQTGKGSVWEVSLEEASLSALANQATNYWMNGHVPQPAGSAHPNIAPYGDLLATADKRWAVPAIGSQSQFKAFCQLLGQPELAEDRRFRSNIDRVENRRALVSALSKLTSDWNSKELNKACSERRIPLGIVKDLSEVLDSPLAHSIREEETLESREAKRVKSFIATRL